MEFNVTFQRAMEIRRQCSQFEQQSIGRSWTAEEIALGFVGDVGDLAKLVMAVNGARSIPDANKKLAHELSDCLWFIMVLSSLHGIDLEAAFTATMDELEQYITEKLLIVEIPVDRSNQMSEGNREIDSD